MSFLPHDLENRYTVGETAERPWGTWEVLAMGPGYVLKRVVVRPGARLSLQFHRHRAEHWTVVQGCGEVEIDQHTSLLKAGEHAPIPVLARHRIRSVGLEPLTFLEIQIGEALDECDIVRLHDDYGRATLLP